MPELYRPNFAGECYLCGASPTVVVEGHIVPDTQLCGVHFFNDRLMSDWDTWNLQTEETE